MFPSQLAAAMAVQAASINLLSSIAVMMQLSIFSGEKDRRLNQQC
jgi:hypothetical protein